MAFSMARQPILFVQRMTVSRERPEKDSGFNSVMHLPV